MINISFIFKYSKGVLERTQHMYAYLSIGKPVDNQADIYSSFKKRG